MPLRGLILSRLEMGSHISWNDAVNQRVADIPVTVILLCVFPFYSPGVGVLLDGTSTHLKVNTRGISLLAPPTLTTWQSSRQRR